MKSAFVRNKNTVSIHNVPNPKPGKRDILVKMRACGLCGSDLEKIYGQYGMHSGRLGHEPAGEIIGIGKSVNGFSLGDRVFIHHHIGCYSCYYCLHGDYTMCDMYQKTNIEPCGLSEKFLVPEWNVSHGGVIKLPDNITFEEGSTYRTTSMLHTCIKQVQLSKRR